MIREAATKLHDAPRRVSRFRYYEPSGKLLAPPVNIKLKEYSAKIITPYEYINFIVDSCCILLSSLYAGFHVYLRRFFDYHVSGLYSSKLSTTIVLCCFFLTESAIYFAYYASIDTTKFLIYES